MNNSIKKGLAVAVILLFFGVSVIPSTGNRLSFDDITPPVTTCTLNPPEPNGNNSWYVSDVEVTLNATDDMSGVNATYYNVDYGEWEIYDVPFVVWKDGVHLVVYFSVDNAKNWEFPKFSEFKIDQTTPLIDLIWEAHGNILCGWKVKFTAYCWDDTSGMDRVTFAINNDVQFTDYNEPYEWTIRWTDALKGVTFKATGYDMAGNLKFDEISQEQIKNYEFQGYIPNSQNIQPHSQQSSPQQASNAFPMIRYLLGM